ncbi:MAG TPA: LiaF domain-containing protein [Blastocatellia bacterium]|nr:LiaF domain-containing protein [Blastocatellia bacterium]
MYCPRCGTQAESGSFCRSCGANLSRVAKVISNPELSRSRASKQGVGTSVGVFNSITVTNEGRDLDGHNAGSVFGHVTIDLTATELPPGETRINLFSIFGGADVYVPDDVGIRITGVTIFGGVRVRSRGLGNGLFSINDYTTPGYAQATRRLHIDATTVFGGIKIKR